MSHITEVHAYAFILKELTEKKGWKKDQIYTQNECQNNRYIKAQLDKETPENIVEISPTKFYVIESKSKRLLIKQAVTEARDYADKINKSVIKAIFVTGVAGNDTEGYIASSRYFHNGEWETVKENSVELTGLLSKTQIGEIITRNSSNLTEAEISDQEFLKSAEEINGILHEGGINKDYRARVMSAVLLALVEGTEIGLDAQPTALVKAINARVDIILQKNGKPEFARFVKIELPSSEDNHIKFKKALVLTIQELLGLNIRSAMTSGKDVLGKFYEVFLKYGNGAKEIGIVLTPRHITKFAAEVLKVNSNDFIYDPTCGTAGFLVSAYDEVRKKTDEQRFKVFKKCGLYGVEDQDSVVSLAIVNMIFRGDGKTNIIEGNCFAKWLSASSTKEGSPCADYLAEDSKNRIPPITKVLMNPPFPKKKTDLKEYLFVEQALKQMQNGGLLFSVLPYSCMIKNGSYLSWRQRMLKNNTLVSVITFPPELFAPIGVRTVGVIIKKGVPHQNQNVFWIRALHDGFKLKKGKRLYSINEEDELEKIKQPLAMFCENQNMAITNEPEFKRCCQIDFDDEELELVPEAYLDEKLASDEMVARNVEHMIRENIAYLWKYEHMLTGDITVQTDAVKTEMKEFSINDLFTIERGQFHALDRLEAGDCPTVSRIGSDNGVVGFFKKPKKAKFYSPFVLTISTVTGDTFVQVNDFIATDNVLVCIPKQKMTVQTLFFIQCLLNNQRWRYSYGRQPYKRIFQKAKLNLPIIQNGLIDEEYIAKVVTAQPYFGALMDKFEKVNEAQHFRKTA